MKDKSKADLEDAVKTLGRWLREDYWKIYCEPQYRFVRKAFTVERYLGNNIETYKFYCFNGKPEVMYLSSNGEHGEKDLYLDYYHTDMNWVDLTLYPPPARQRKGCETGKLRGNGCTDGKAVRALPLCTD